ncbi:MAG: GDP-mannose 4,6-dehydratase, partial [Acidobacteriota bacterium]|nr:GDP-mannose 4,6-dehydratase [Acidobacteriota bacterium]
ATYGEPERLPIDETTPQSPTNPYGETKLALERLLFWGHKTMDFKPVFLRYFNAAGASLGLGEDHHPETHLIPLVLQVALGEREQIEVFGDDYDTADGTCVRDYVHVVDLARAHLLALSAGVIGAFNLGTGVGYSVRQIIDVAAEVTGRPIASAITPRRQGDPPILVANADKAAKTLNWQPQSSDLRTIIADAWDWHRRYPKGYKSPGGEGWRVTADQQKPETR